ncbi:uncharacterized protein MYCFIDRAFT_170843 [Pseudocercospora fijiensis CIRAD86]|uniref:Uncharacterized protein n=1 Tax=Pseudocercospora fijiensis (strain CIRAD86) TaxID=383855 RepID=N1QCJ1_PSEFD|nr:uncharacterized protein MYCFIDRAFT_170843 [Pseudocercospora fijiensis CIRAD86]EME89387.1 hypothetical protein MYCFIDRAFT_170843 [Pseudocercospora fijiensis CIRAD86]
MKGAAVFGRLVMQASTSACGCRQSQTSNAAWHHTPDEGVQAPEELLGMSCEICINLYNAQCLRTQVTSSDYLIYFDGFSILFNAYLIKDPNAGETSTHYDKTMQGLAPYPYLYQSRKSTSQQLSRLA